MSDLDTSVTSDAPAEHGKRKDKEAVANSPAVLERLAAELVRIDRVLAIGVPLLAFLLASFVARNSDVWLHLGTGRFLVEGKSSIGVDPFAYTTANTYWLNQSWLFDGLLYGLTMLARGPEGAGGVLAVVVKALAMASLAALLLTMRRPGQGLFIPAVCTGLAVLVMAPRMTLQPVCVSLLFLGLTLFFLVRDGKAEPAADVRGFRVLFTASPRRLYVLPVLFALWVNLDEWFLLGPLTVLLYLLGEKLQRVMFPERSGPDVAAPAEYRTLAVVLGVGLLACLLSPHHARVFATLPAELFATIRLRGLQGDMRFAPLFVTPFDSNYFTLNYGLHAAGLAYFPLLVLGPLSFFVTRSHWRVWRLLVWTAFAVLSASSMQLVAFFAVVAGPITVLNLQDFFATQAEPVTPRTLRRQLAVRRLTLLLGIGLLAAAWPGWLQAHPGNAYLARRVGWGVEVEPSLREAVYKLDFWRTQGLLRPEDHGFNFLPDVAHYCAWFCPEEKGFLDGRYRLFTDVAASYTDIRYMLAGGTPDDAARRGPGALPDWQQVFRDHGINHVILTGPNWERTAPIVSRLLLDANQWTPLYLDGRTSIFAWKDPKRKDAETLSRLTLDLKPLAFGADAVQAPTRGPGRSPRQRSAWQQYATAPTPPPLDGDRAAVSSFYFTRMVQQRAVQYVNRDFRWIDAAGLFGTANPSADVLASASALVARRRLEPNLRPLFPRAWDLGPPEALVLSVRYGRRAVAENPDDLAAYWALAQGTKELWSAQECYWADSRLPPPVPPAHLTQALRERKLAELPAPWLSGTLGVRHLLRRVQELTALNQVLAGQPDAERVHLELFRLYWGMNYFDVALEHLREHVRCLQRIRERLKDNTDLRDTLEQRTRELDQFEKAVDEMRRYYELEASSLPPRAQAQHAFRPYGLARQCLTMLAREDLTKLGGEEAHLLVYLYLTLGRPDELRGLSDAQKPVLGPVKYAMCRAIASAALGDYQDADDFLREAIEAMPKPATPPLLGMLQALTFGQLQPHLLTQRTLGPFLQEQVVAAHQAFRVGQQADDLQVLRGLLALDVGDNEQARRHFQQALTASGPRYEFESRPIAKRYLELLNATGR